MVSRTVQARRARRDKVVKQRGLEASSLAQKTFARDKKHVSRATLQQYHYVISLWHEFLAWMGLSDDAICHSLRERADFPQLDMFKRFFLWWIAGSHGRRTKNKKPAVVTADNLWDKLSTALARLTGTQPPTFIITEMNSFIHNGLVTEQGLEHSQPVHRYADELNLEVLLDQVWCWEADELWERDRIQFSLLTLIMFYTDGRLGAFLPSTLYPTLFLPYEHLQLMLVRCDGAELFCLEVTEHFMKGQKDRPSQRLQLLWLEESHPGYCPVLFFLALAFADQVFMNISSPQELFAIRLDPSEVSRRIPYRQEKQSEPVFKTRRWSAIRQTQYCKEHEANWDQRVQADREGWDALYALANASVRNEHCNPMMYGDKYRKLLREVSIRAGYENHITPYHIRKGVGNRLDESKDVSSSQLNQIMGHTGLAQQVYQSNYQNSLASVDVPGLVLRRQTRTGFHRVINELRGLRRYEPMERMPAALIHNAIRLKRSQNSQEDCNMEDPRGRSSDGVISYSLRQAALKQWREQAQPRTEKQHSTGAATSVPGSIETLGSLLKNVTRSAFLISKCPQRMLVKESFKTATYDLRDGKVLGALIDLAHRDFEYSIYYANTKLPEVFPDRDEGCQVRCRDCGIFLDGFSISHKHQHLWRHARERECRHELLPWKPQYCYRCQQWFSTGEAWRAHCGLHMKSLDLYCGILKVAGLCVSAGRCPFCLSCNQTASQLQEWEQVLVQFDDTTHFTNHISSHLAPLARCSTPETIACPHPLCSKSELLAVTDLIYHFHDIHGIDEAFKITATLERIPHAKTSTSVDQLAPIAPGPTAPEPSKQELSQEDPVKPYFCSRDGCPKRFTTLSGLRYHTKNCIRWTCPMCGDVLRTVHTREQHICHKPSSRGWLCIGCKIQISSSINASTHLIVCPGAANDKRTPRPKLVSCRGCRTGFALLGGFEQHWQYCGYPWSCPGCSANLRSHTMLLKHKCDLVTVNHQWRCPRCQKAMMKVEIASHLVYCTTSFRPSPAVGEAVPTNTRELAFSGSDTLMTDATPVEHIDTPHRSQSINEIALSGNAKEVQSQQGSGVTAADMRAKRKQEARFRLQQKKKEWTKNAASQQSIIVLDD